MGSNSKAVVLLQGAVMSAAHLSAVFSHQRESHRSSFLHGGVCVHVQWEIFWTSILFVPLLYKCILKEFPVHSCALESKAGITVQRSF